MTWNRSSAYAFYKERVYKERVYKERVYKECVYKECVCKECACKECVDKLQEEVGYDTADAAAAWEKAQEWGERIPIGIVYQDASLPSYEDQVVALEAGPLADQPLEPLTADQVEALQAEIM